MKAILIDAAPTLTEILSTKGSADGSTPFTVESFYEYCKTARVLENFNCIVAIDKYVKDYYEDSAKSVAAADHIIKRFVVEGSLEQVNLPQSVVTSILDKWNKNCEGQKPDLQIFQDCRYHAFVMLESDVYPRYVRSCSVKINLAIATKEALWFMPGAEKMTLKRFFSFPNPVNEADARIHAFCVICLVTAGVLLDYFEILGVPYLHLYVVLGYLLRLTAGPKIDPQAFIVLFVLKPMFQKVFFSFPPDDFVPGPPKRFSQAIGFLTSLTATLLQVSSLKVASYSVWAMLVFLCVLLLLFEFCLGCFIFHQLMRAGIVPKEICEKCNNHFIIAKKASSHKQESKTLNSIIVDH